MKTQLNRPWQVLLPSQLVQDAGFSEGESLKCRALPGMICLSPESAAFSFPADEKKT